METVVETWVFTSLVQSLLLYHSSLFLGICYFSVRYIEQTCQGHISHRNNLSTNISMATSIIRLHYSWNPLWWHTFIQIYSSSHGNAFGISGYIHLDFIIKLYTQSSNHFPPLPQFLSWGLNLSLLLVQNPRYCKLHIQIFLFLLLLCIIQLLVRHCVTLHDSFVWWMCFFWLINVLGRQFQNTTLVVFIT